MALGMLLPGCGFLTAGFAASSKNSATDSNAAPSLSGLEVRGLAIDAPKESPALIRLIVADEESDPTTVELSMILPDDPGNPRLLTALAENPVTLATSRAGMTHELTWDFADEPGLPPDASYVEGVRILASARGGAASELVIGLGNDAPETTRVFDQPGEVSGVVPVRFIAADSSDDLVDLKFEIFEPGAAGWHLARPAGIAPETDTPEFAFQSVVAERSGVELVFFWDSEHPTQAHDLVGPVRLRVTPRDDVAEGAPYEAQPLQVDNNAAPVTQLFNDTVLANSDNRRGIPVPFGVSDEEGDLVEMVFQWTLRDREFPELPSSLAELDRVLEDSSLRSEYQICTPFPNYARGAVTPIDATSVRLPELGSGESWILAGGVEGKQLELLRPSFRPEAISPTWASNPLSGPVAALPLDQGLTALVLDAFGGSGRLREIELATGTVVREIATLGAGAPSALSMDRNGRFALVASEIGGIWRIESVELVNGDITEIAVSDDSHPGPIRDIESLGTNRAVFTVETALLAVDYHNPNGTRVYPLRLGLQGPSGLALNPLNQSEIFVCERDAPRENGTGRVSRFDLDTGVLHPIPIRDVGEIRLDRPEDIALTREGVRLLVVTNPPEGTRVIGVELNGPDAGRPYALGPTNSAQISSVSVGMDDLVLSAVSEANELLVGGGVEQSRVATSYDPSGQRLSVARGFEPMPRPGQPWRLSPGKRYRIRTPRGEQREASFLWDSSDAIQGLVRLRATAWDAEAGRASEAQAEKDIAFFSRQDLSLPLAGLGPLVFGNSMSIVDIDRDGDVDIVISEIHTLTVYAQVSPVCCPLRPFALEARILSTLSSDQFYSSVGVADLDGDGDLDIVSGRTGVDPRIEFFLQGPDGSFELSDEFIAGEFVDPTCLHLADLDGDGDVDLAVASSSVGLVAIYHQIGNGIFDPEPQLVGSQSSYAYTFFGIASGDLDSDGDLDLAVANAQASGVMVFYQTSRNVFEHNPALFDAVAPSYPVIADLDGDGDLDLAFTFRQDSFNPSGVEVVIQEEGTLESLPIELNVDVHGDIHGLKVADCDQDGDLDLVVLHDAGAAVLVQRSPGQFDEAALEIHEVEYLNYGALGVADLTGDGALEMVIAETAPLEPEKGLTILFGATEAEASADQGLAFGRTYDVADIDADGSKDVVSTASTFRGIQIWRQGRPRRFSAAPEGLATQTPSSFPPISVACADLDNDGDLDIASKETDANGLVMWFQGNSGLFERGSQSVGAGHLGKGSVLLAEDMNNDGMFDLILQTQDDASLAIYRGLGQGRFADDPDVVEGSLLGRYSAAAAADVDRDGRMDLVANYGNSIDVYFQRVSGGYDVVRISGDGGGSWNPPKIHVIDLDGDGDNDLVVGTSLDAGIAYQTNLRVFSIYKRLPTYTQLFSRPLSVVDADNDGDYDIVSPTSAYKQTRPGVMRPAPEIVLPGWVDLDGDGDLDFLIPNTGLVYWGGQ